MIGERRMGQNSLCSSRCACCICNCLGCSLVLAWRADDRLAISTRRRRMDDCVPSVVLAPDCALVYGQVQVLLHREERQPEDLPQFHTHREWIFHSCIFFGHEVHGHIDATLNDIATTVEQVELYLLKVLRKAPILLKKCINFVKRLCARVLDSKQIERNVEVQVDSLPDIKVVYPVCEQHI